MTVLGIKSKAFQRSSKNKGLDNKHPETSKQAARVALTRAKRQDMKHRRLKLFEYVLSISSRKTIGTFVLVVGRSFWASHPMFHICGNYVWAPQAAEKLNAQVT